MREARLLHHLRHAGAAVAGTTDRARGGIENALVSHFALAWLAGLHVNMLLNMMVIILFIWAWPVKLFFGVFLLRLSVLPGAAEPYCPRLLADVKAIPCNPHICRRQGKDERPLPLLGKPGKGTATMI
jgi:hypothetical protein